MKRKPATTLFDSLAAPSDPVASAGFTRRRFLAAGATLGGVLGAPLLSSCLGGGDDGGAPQPPPDRALFFDLSYHDSAERQYFLVGGGQRYALVRIADKPEVLTRARQANAFLAAVPDSKITHHVESAVFSADAPTLTFLGSGADANGVWAMDAVYLQIPSSGSTNAYAQARAKTPTGPLPLSASRRLYGVRPADTEQDLRDERALLGPAAHAAAIMGAHPELCSLETASAHHIHSNYIDSDPATGTIAKALGTAKYGPATPETTSGDTNTVGWATLIPVVDDTTGKPYVNTRGKSRGCNQYLPRLHRDLTEYAGPAMARMTASVGNDESLGVDVTGLDPKPGDPAKPAYAGKMWTRQDGTAFVDVATPAVGAGTDSVVMTQTQDPGQYLTRLNTSSTTSGTLTTVSMSLLNAATRYLGVYLQFFNDVKPDTALTLTDLPEYNDGSILAGH
ncbi:MAG: hypothetical protein ABI277_14800 [Burkholderiaceae bacterium]